MTQKVYVKPSKAIFVAQVVIIPLFMIFGIILIFINLKLSFYGFNPPRYFLVILRGIFLKGSGINILWPQMLALLIMGVGILAVNSMRLQKSLG